MKEIMDTSLVEGYIFFFEVLGHLSQRRPQAHTVISLTSPSCFGAELLLELPHAATLTSIAAAR